MMIKITEKCTMNCRHCMNAAGPDGKHMTMKTFKDVLNFLHTYRLGESHLILTGGEPTEHPHFLSSVTITTNGELMQNQPELFLQSLKKAKIAGMELNYQVSADVRYYPRRIQTHKRIFREPHIFLCDDCVQQIYPQGRAKENQLPWKAQCSKCFNVRSLSHQLPNEITLRNLEWYLASAGKFCTPHISVNGEIKLGESDLCPVCASIYDDMDEIMDKIRKFQCGACDFINEQLPEKYRKLL